jgi:hypothetical protein
MSYAPSGSNRNGRRRRQSEGLLLARAQEVNLTDVKGYLKILETIVIKNVTLKKPQILNNLDETNFSFKQEALGSYSRKNISLGFSMSHLQRKVSKSPL